MQRSARLPVCDELPPMFVLMLPEEPESLRLQAVGQLPPACSPG